MSRIVIAAVTAEAAMRLAQRTDRPEDLGPATNPERAADGWRRFAFPVPPPPARAPEAPRDVLAKVRKLLTLAGDRGATEAEAANAASAAQRLIEQHRLDDALRDADGDGRQAEASAPLDEGPVGLDPHPIDVQKKIVAWKGVLVGGIAKANGCKHYWDAGAIRIVGSPSRVATVRTLYGWLSREVDRLGSEAAQGRGRSYGHAWRVGCATRLAERIREAAEAGRIAARDEARQRGVALARVETALARTDSRLARQAAEAWTRQHLNLRSTGRTRIASASGWHDGKAAGNKIRLTGHAALGRGTSGKLGGGS